VHLDNDTKMKAEVLNELEARKKELFLFCLANKIPCFCIFANETESGTEYEHVVVTPHEADMTLTDDKITKYSASLNKNFELRLKANQKIEDNMDQAIDDLLAD